ncbi:MAG: energy transducer TonB [Bacteroidota bacterium]
MRCLTFLLALACVDAMAQTETDEFVCVLYEVEPELIGGMDAVADAVRWLDVQAVVSFTVYVQFTVERDGSVTSPEVIRGCRADSPHASAFDQAAVAAVPRLRFRPGEQLGRPVRVRYTLPVRFGLSERPRR